MAACSACGKAHRLDQQCPDPAVSRIGHIIGGKYRVVRHIGEGGMASVYEARHTEIHRSFALKFLHPWLCADEEWLERFRREASAGGALISEHITAIVDIGLSHTDTPYIVMEYLSGEDLGQRLAREFSLKPLDAIDIVTQACRGLGVAHAAGVIHRDLKPENLFLCERQLGGTVVKILDFGIAKLKNSHLAQVTRAGMVIGTPFYMSPEQAVGRADVDHRSDIYALGVILYELLSGEKPFLGDNHKGVLNQIIAGAPPLLQDHCPTVSAELAQVVQRAIAKSPGDRFQNVAEFADALLAFTPQGRRSSRTATGFGSRAAWRAVSSLQQPTVAEPNLTVRVTGSSRAEPVRDWAEIAPLEHPTLAGDEFEDATDAQLSLQDELDVRDSQPGRARGDADEALGSPAGVLPTAALLSGVPTLPPTSRPRVRQHAGRFEAARLSDVEHASQPPARGQSVSLRRTLAPLGGGLLAIVLIVAGVASSTHTPRAAGKAYSDKPYGESAAASAAMLDQPALPAEGAPGGGAATTPGAAGPAAEATAQDPSEGSAAERALDPAGLEAPGTGGAAGAVAESAAAGEQAGARGSLSVQSDLAAEVFIGGLRRGRTPLRGLRLPPGEHRVVLVNPARGKRTKTVRISAQQLTSVSIKFDEGKVAAGAESEVAPPAAASAPRQSTGSMSGAPRNCTPRWYVDAQGVRRVKPECLFARGEQ